MITRPPSSCRYCTYLEKNGASSGWNYKRVGLVKVLSILLVNLASYLCSPLGARKVRLFPPFSNLTAVGSKDVLNPLIKHKFIAKPNQMYFIKLLQKMLTSYKCRFIVLLFGKLSYPRTKQINQSDQVCEQL